MVRGVFYLFLATVPILISVNAVQADEKEKPGIVKSQTHEKKPVRSNGPPASKKTEASQEIPDGPTLNILIRRTLLTINDANLSGNYSVVRDLAAPGFQSANDQAKLVGIFADLRNRKIDLAPILFFDPKLVRPPKIEAGGMLHLSGFVPTEPEQVVFDMLFEKSAERWRLFGIAVNTVPVHKPEPTAPSSTSTPDHP